MEAKRARGLVVVGPQELSGTRAARPDARKGQPGGASWNADLSGLPCLCALGGQAAGRWTLDSGVPYQVPSGVWTAVVVAVAVAMAVSGGGAQRGYSYTALAQG